MKRRIRENSVKAIIYILLFVILFIKGFILENSERMDVKVNQASLPLPTK